MGIGSKIKELRKRQGITQGALARRIGVTPSAIGNYECDVSFPKEEVLMRLFGALECTPNELFGAESSLNIREYTLLSKYRKLDEQGKDRVDALTEAELLRVDDSVEEIPVAARKARPGAPLKLKKQSKQSLLDLPDYGRKRK